MRRRAILLIVLAFSLNCLGRGAQSQIEEKGYSDITVKELMEKMERGEEFLLLDVRTPEEYAEGYIEGAVLIPYTEIEKRYEELGYKDSEIVVYCKMGYRSAIAGRALAKLGFGNVKNLLGGIEVWKEMGGEVIKK